MIEKNTKLSQNNVTHILDTANFLNSFEQRELVILQRIQKYYSLKLGHKISYKETQEIADNLLNFAQAIYGT